MAPEKTKKLYKVLRLGLLAALMVTLFHPVSGHLSLSYDGEPVRGALAQLGAVPSAIAVLLFTAMLMGLIALGTGALLLVIFAGVGILLLGFAAPFLLPLLMVGIAVYAISHALR